ncbi:sporulation protein [Streptomyces armeniacus]|uniref:Sporulation protein n=1 Tax=Streptomyces armeniacus TaxID=83291 RepID=A0A345XXK8_9ACTN|nr:sporulation protein [Streptomyces armeniacus]AXK36374.1 sporulation protein [Streptomyces armeniacus]
MVFKRVLGAFGVGGPDIDTVLDGDPVLPGGTLTGQVHLRGGSSDLEIEHLTLELVAHVEAEHAEGETHGAVVFDRTTLAGGFRLSAGEEASRSFSVTVPWETPVTELYGQPLGVVLGLRTELAVAGAKDAGDLDPLAVRPLPVQEAVLEAFGQLGFGFTSADLELGHIRGTWQQLPFYQEIELAPPPGYVYAAGEIELTFLAGPQEVEVVLEADKRCGPFGDGHDAVHRFTVAHHGVAQVDWAAEVEGWLRQLLGHREPAPSKDGHEHGHMDHGHDGRHRSGPGAGAVAAGAAAGVAVGVVGGMVAAEVVDEIGDAFEGDEEEDGEE